MCPVGTICATLTNPAESLCALPEQLDACEGKAARDPCALTGAMTARCYDGVCLADGCGNRRFDPGEQCDDGNTTGGDGCSADCLSDEMCGNGAQDPDETCDDGNDLDHDRCTSTCSVEQLQWFEHSLRPPPRVWGAAAYDARRDRIVLFGGFDNVSNVSLTYEWNGTGWIRFVGSEPPPRTNAAMAFDGERVILHGGMGLADTWAFDGTTWTPLLVPGPPPHQQRTMAYDANRKRVVLFGNDTDAATWEWDGAAWTQAMPATRPPSRVRPMLAYDPLRRVIVLAGGDTTTTPRTDTWVYDGVDWRDVTPASGPLPEGVMAFDAGSGQMIAFGGSTTNTRAWNGTQWTNLSTSGAPSGRRDLAMASMGSRIVLFGGRENNTFAFKNDTWIFEADTWTEARMPGPRHASTIERDHARAQILVHGGQVVANPGPGLETTNETWLLSATGWRLHTALPRPPPALGRQMTYDYASNTIVLFGGSGTSGVINDTWIWNGEAWAQGPTSPAPPARFNGAMAFDGTNVVLFGGVVTGIGPHVDAAARANECGDGEHGITRCAVQRGDRHQRRAG